jgi:MFS family permease
MTLESNFKRNIRTYYFYTIFSNLLILGPILIIYLKAKGLTFTQIMLINSISAVSVVLFEVPTGAVADRIGRKYSVIIGAGLWGISLMVYVFARGFYLFALAEIIFALGSTFKSGSDIALIYDSLKKLNREDEFQRIEGRAKSYSFYAQAVGSIAAGFLYKLNMELPMIISSVFMVLTVIVSLLFIEPPIEDKHDTKAETYIKQITESGKYILSNEKVKAIILYSMVFYIFYRAGFFFYQPYFQEVNIPVDYFGVIFFIFNITAGIISKNSYKIMNKTKKKTLMFLSSLLIASFIILGITKIWIGVFAILFQQVARGLYIPVTRKYLNKNIPSNKRATILSFFSLLTNLSAALAYPLFGALSDFTNIFTTHIVIAAVMTALTYLTSIYMKKRIGR